MTQHTPGPWMISRADTGLTSIYPSGSPERVADVYCPLNRTGTLEANARLIAKAPKQEAIITELLEALKGCAEYLTETLQSCYALENAQAAIAKATE